MCRYPDVNVRHAHKTGPFSQQASVQVRLDRFPPTVPDFPAEMSQAVTSRMRRRRCRETAFNSTFPGTGLDHNLVTATDAAQLQTAHRASGYQNEENEATHRRATTAHTQYNEPPT